MYWYHYSVDASGAETIIEQARRPGLCDWVTQYCKKAGHESTAGLL
jgi:hypothetical protein